MTDKRGKSSRRLFSGGSSSQQHKSGSNPVHRRSTSENAEIPTDDSPESNFPPSNNNTQLPHELNNLSVNHSQPPSSHGSSMNEQGEPSRTAETPRDSRPFLRPDRNKSKPGFYPNKPGVEKINTLWKSFLSVPWASWRFIPQEVKRTWFEEWRRYVQYAPQHDDHMFKAFKRKAQRGMQDAFNGIRKKNKKPDWMGDSVCAELKRIWATPEFKLASERAKKNSQSRGGPSGHLGGCISHSTHEMRLAEKLQREPTHVEMFKYMHRRDDGSWVDTRSELAQAKYDEVAATKATQLGIQPDELDPKVQVELWKSVTTPNKKGQTYGLGYHEHGSSSSWGSTSSQPWIDPQVAKLEAELSTMKTHMEGMQEKFSSMEAAYLDQKSMMEAQQVMMQKMMDAVMGKGKKKKGSSSKRKSKKSRFQPEPVQEEEYTSSGADTASSNDDRDDDRDDE